MKKFTLILNIFVSYTSLCFSVSSSDTLHNLQNIPNTELKIISGIRPPEWEKLSSNEFQRIEKKARDEKCQIQKGRKFDMGQNDDYAYFSSDNKYDMLFHSNQYLGGGNRFGWVVLERLKKDGNPEVIFEKYSNYTDGKFIEIDGKIMLEVYDDYESGSGKISTSMYIWKNNALIEILKYHSSNYNYQSPFSYTSYRIFNSKENAIYIIRRNEDSIKNIKSYLVDLYEWSLDKYVLKKKDLKLTEKRKTIFIDKDTNFRSFIKD